MVRVEGAKPQRELRPWDLWSRQLAWLRQAEGQLLPMPMAHSRPCHFQSPLIEPRTRSYLRPPQVRRSQPGAREAVFLRQSCVREAHVIPRPRLVFATETGDVACWGDDAFRAEMAE